MKAEWGGATALVLRERRLGEFLEDERGSDVVESVVLTAVVLLIGGAVLLRLCRETGEMFLQSILSHFQ